MRSLKLMVMTALLASFGLVVPVASRYGFLDGLPAFELDFNPNQDAALTGDPSPDQVPLEPSVIPQFAHELAIPRVFAPTIVRDSSGHVIRHEYTVSVAHTTVQMLPPGFPRTTVRAFGGQVKIPGSSHTEFVRSVPGPVFENTRGIPSLVRWRDQIAQPTFMPVDPTLHWANPTTMEPPLPPFTPFPPGYENAQFPVAHVTHTHGLVVKPHFDGTAEEWFTPFGHRGPSLREPGLRDAERAAVHAALLSRPRDGRDPAGRLRRERGGRVLHPRSEQPARPMRRPPCRKENSRSRSSCSAGRSSPTAS